MTIHFSNNLCPNKTSRLYLPFITQDILQIVLFKQIIPYSMIHGAHTISCSMLLCMYQVLRHFLYDTNSLIILIYCCRQ